MTEPAADMGIVVLKAGGPEALEWARLETAAPGPGEVRLAQQAIGVNFIDAYFRSGLYPWPSTPLIPGVDAATGSLGQGLSVGAGLAIGAAADPDGGSPSAGTRPTPAVPPTPASRSERLSPRSKPSPMTSSRPVSPPAIPARPRLSNPRSATSECSC